MGRQTVYAFAEKLNLAGVGSERAADEIEKGCLSRPVGPHHAKDLRSLNSQADTLDRDDATKSLGDLIESEKRH